MTLKSKEFDTRTSWREAFISDLRRPIEDANAWVSANVKPERLVTIVLTKWDTVIVWYWE